MNTVSQTFNWSRFVAALRKEVVENNRTILFSIMGVFAILTIFMLLGNLILHTPMEVQMEMADKVPQTVVYVILAFVMCIMASMAFKGLTNKEGRTALMMSPSSTLEKFLVNVLIYVVAMFVLFFACAQLADLVRIAVLKPFEDSNFVVPGPINFLKTFSFTVSEGRNSMDPEVQTWMTTSMIIGTISSAAIYFLGSVLWPRLSLLKTWAVIFVIQTVTIILLIVFINVLGDPKAFGRWLADFIKHGNFFTVMFAFYTVLTIVGFALSWILLKRKDVVSLKWWK